MRHPATAGGMQSRSPPAERRPRLRGEARGRHQIPMARPAHIPEIGPRRLRDAPPDVRGASVIQKGRARDVAVRVAHGPVTWIFRHPAPEQGRAPPNTHGLRSSEAPTRGRLVGGSGTHGATGAARRDRPQVTERNPGTAPQRRRRGGREARSSSGVRVASAASGARGPPGGRATGRRDVVTFGADDGGATKYPWTTRGKPPRVVSPSVDDAERAPGSGRALLESVRKVLTAP